MREIYLLVHVVVAVASESLEFSWDSFHRLLETIPSHPAFQGFMSNTHDVLPPTLNQAKLSHCLDRHQYAVWNAAVKSESCDIFIHSVAALNEQETEEDKEERHFIEETAGILHQLEKPKSDTPVLTDVLKPLRERFQPDGILDKKCRRFEPHLVPCLQSLEIPLQGVFDDPVCQESGFFPAGMTQQQSWHMVINLFNFVCASTSALEDSTLAPRCSSLFLESLRQPQDIFQLITYLWRSIGSCSSTFGCCGNYVAEFVSTFKDFDLEGFQGRSSQGISFLVKLFSQFDCRSDSDDQCHGIPVVNTTIENAPNYTYIIPSDRESTTMQPFLHTQEYAPTEPQQIHLALNGRSSTDKTSNGMTVMWVTKEWTRSMVFYGKQPSQLRRYAFGTSVSYMKPMENVVIAGERVPISFHHRVELTELDSDTVYYYQVFNGVEYFSEIYSFRTPPLAKSKKPLTLAIFGDMALYENQETLATLERYHEETDVYFEIGDIGYSDNWYLHNLASFGYEKVYNAYMNVIQKFAATKPFMVLPGNHETECHSLFVCMRNAQLRQGLRNYTAFNHRFSMPSNASNGVQNMWYSFNVGLMHVVSISTETDYENSPHNGFAGAAGQFGDQAAWLEADLAQANAERHLRPWIIVLGHRPIYSVDPSKRKSGKHRNEPSGDQRYLQKFLEPYLEKFKVDLYFCGHLHSYERQTPIFQNQPYNTSGSSLNYYHQPQHTIYLIHGSSGNEELHTMYPPGSRPTWGMVLDNQYNGAGYLTVVNATNLRWEFKSQEKVIDYFDLYKSRG